MTGKQTNKKTNRVECTEFSALPSSLIGQGGQHQVFKVVLKENMLTSKSISKETNENDPEMQTVKSSVNIWDALTCV